MKKIVRLTESDLVNIVKRVIEEQTTPAVIDAGYSDDMKDYAIVLSQPTITGGSGYKGKVTAQVKFNGVRIKEDGSPVTKGNTILQWCDINSMLVEYAAERNPDKYGAYTLGTNIPIISEAESRAMNPDYYLVLPWHFKAEFIEREKEALEKGTGFIFPIPTIDIYKK